MESRSATALVGLPFLLFLAETDGGYTAALGLLALGATEARLSNEQRRGFVLVAVAAAFVVATTELLSLPDAVAAASLLAVVAGEGGARVRGGRSAKALGYFVAAGVAGTAGGVAVGASPALAVAVGSAAALAGGTVRALDDSLWVVLVVAAVGAWAVTVVGVTASAAVVGVAAVGVVALAAAANFAGVMTVSGSAAGALLSYFVLLAGGVGWFIVLGVFVGIGAATTAYGKDEKEEMGLAEHSRGRGFSNVAANGTVALVAALVYSTAPDSTVAGAATAGFVGCMATAAADTASSEIGSVAGEPRLITTLERVPAGTDGGVSWQGEVVTVVAVAVIAAAALVVGIVPPEGAVVAAFGGLVGAHVDSLLGATVEGRWLGNEGVNFSACTVGAVAAAVLVYAV